MKAGENVFMDRLIAQVLRYNNYQLLRTNIPDVIYYGKEKEDYIDVILITDIDEFDITSEKFEDILRQTRNIFQTHDVNVRFTSFIYATELSKVANICKNENYADRRYAVLSQIQEVVLFEFQNNREDEHIDMIKRWEAMSEEEREATYRSINKKQKDFPIDFTLCNTIIVILNLISFMYLCFKGDTTDPNFLREFGALYWDDVINNHQYYRIASAMFMHSGIEHLFGNMVSLLFIGSFLEKIIGHGKYILIYFTSGILAGVTSVIYNMSIQSNSVCVGASGAVFGIVGAVMVMLLVSNAKNMRRDFRRLVIYSFLSILAGVTSFGIDNSAHIGGLVSGFIVMLILNIMYPIKTTENKTNM